MLASELQSTTVGHLWLGVKERVEAGDSPVAAWTLVA